MALHIRSEDFLNLGNHKKKFVKIIVKLHLQAFWQNFENGKMQKLVSVYKTFKNPLLQNYSTKFLDVAHR